LKGRPFRLRSQSSGDYGPYARIHFGDGVLKSDDIKF
jgi:hypothetical protein